MDYKTMKKQDIYDWCVANADKGAAKWLADAYEGKFTDGKAPTHPQLKNLFCKKFMPNLLKGKKNDMASVIEYLRNL